MKKNSICPQSRRTLEKINRNRRRTQINADNAFVFNLRESAFICGLSLSAIFRTF